MLTRQYHRKALPVSAPCALNIGQEEVLSFTEALRLLLCQQRQVAVRKMESIQVFAATRLKFSTELPMVSTCRLIMNAVTTDVSSCGLVVQKPRTGDGGLLHQSSVQ